MLLGSLLDDNSLISELEYIFFILESLQFKNLLMWWVGTEKFHALNAATSQELLELLFEIKLHLI